MAPQILLDAHIHLWPSTATSSTDHAWMSPGHKMAQRHGISEYKPTVSSSPVQATGFIFVETDRFLPSASPDVALSEATDDEAACGALRKWARAPLEELEFLRRLVEGSPVEGDGFVPGDEQLCKGLVVWAPFTLPVGQFRRWVDVVKEELGEVAWRKVVGFRYLLQGKGVEGVRKAVASEGFVENLAELGRLGGGKGKAFDIGVDCHRDGVEALEVVGELIERVRVSEGEKEVRFVLS